MADDLFRTFFYGNGEAAVLACDEIGVVPMELLHVPKAYFYESANPLSSPAVLAALIGTSPQQPSQPQGGALGPRATDEQATIRYNMRERFRQQLFRRLFAVRQRIIQSGALETMWAEREMLRPDAPGIPDFPSLMPPASSGGAGATAAASPHGANQGRHPLAGRQQQQQQQQHSDFDTQSDSDGDPLVEAAAHPEALRDDFVLLTRSGRLLHIPPSASKPRQHMNRSRSPTSPEQRDARFSPPSRELPPWRKHALKLERSRQLGRPSMTPQSATFLPAAHAPQPPPMALDASASVISPVAIGKRPGTGRNSRGNAEQRKSSGESAAGASLALQPGSSRHSDSPRASLSDIGPAGKEPTSPSSAAYPPAPAIPPICKNPTPRTLAQEEAFLRSSLAGLQRFAREFQKAEKAEVMQRAALQQRQQQTALISVAKAGESPRSASLSTNGSSAAAHLIAHPPPPPPVEPRLPVVGGQTRRHVEALVRRTMMDIAESAVLAQRAQELRREDDEWWDSVKPGGPEMSSGGTSHQQRALSPGSSLVSSLRAPTGVNPLTPAEWRRLHEDREQRIASERLYEQQRAELLERRTEESLVKAQRATSTRKKRFDLVSTVVDMRHGLATERRECLRRSEEVKTVRTFAQRDQRRVKAELLQEQKRAVAYINRVAHDQLRSLRSRLHDSVVTMSERNRWEIPDAVREIIATGDAEGDGAYDDDEDDRAGDAGLAGDQY